MVKPANTPGAAVDLDPESVRASQARAQEADRISHDDPVRDPEGRALVQAIHDRKATAKSE